MRGKGVFFILVLLFAISLTSAAIQNESQKVGNAYDCLYDKVEDRCDSISITEKTFSLLAIGQCKTEILEEAGSEACWPEDSCSIKTTAQAIIALGRTKVKTENSSDWLVSRMIVPSDLEWFLQIDTDEASACSVTFESGSYDLSFDADKKIISSAGQCFSTAQDDYWLKINADCLDEEFTVSCDKSFTSNFLYKEANSDVIYVSAETYSAGAGSSTSLKVNSFCFGAGNSCNYEESLWAALALSIGDYNDEVSSVLPYLVAKSSDNLKFFPEAFLYQLTEYSEYHSVIMSRQNTRGYFSAPSSNDKFYDTALALMPFSGETLSAKDKAKEWLLSSSVQGSDGCWESNIVNTALLLYYIWPDKAPKISCFSDNECATGEKCIRGQCKRPQCTKDSDCFGGKTCSPAGYCIGSGGDDCDSNNDCGDGFCDDGDCVECLNNSHCTTSGEVCSNGMCVSSSDILPSCETSTSDRECRSSNACAGDGGTILSDYSCTSITEKCCSVPSVTETCAERNGEICTSGETCSGGQRYWDASDLKSGEACCVGGTCESSQVQEDCLDNNGQCKSSCSSDEEESLIYSCSSLYDACCMKKEKPKGNYLWLIILGILIILVIIGIIFKEKLRLLFLRFKGREAPSTSYPRRPGFPPPTTRIPLSRPMPQRRIMPPPQRPSVKPLPKRESNSELDDVLKKLKDMGR